MTSELSCPVTLPPVLDITQTTPLAAQLNACRGKDVVVDASNVERVGAQCIQVLLSAAATWAQDGAELIVSEPSAAFAEGLQSMGLEIADMTVRSA
ncbi:STAS domain-containing protein [Mesorhizobium xinjiangense]|uniref:STAS domain-containing protein n=1 Tax=Mesorhizobium xinjiangense TaxID=2678685 RepID=UPI0012EE24A6|nr:STAS domain-containing protein [Mesorhizobium xinjiangense]